MQLTGKAKEDFEKWLYNYFKDPSLRTNIGAKLKSISFENNRLSMTFGVYQDFFDENGIYIICGKNLSNNSVISKMYNYVIDLNKKILLKSVHYEERYTNINEAREAAILKACELYNEKHK